MPIRLGQDSGLLNPAFSLHKEKLEETGAIQPLSESHSSFAFALPVSSSCNPMELFGIIPDESGKFGIKRPVGIRRPLVYLV